MLSILCVCVPAAADNPDVAVVSGTDSYEYRAVGGNIIIDRNSSLVYQCVGRPTSIEVTEFYDDDAQIGKVSIKGLKGVKPQYRMYAKDGIFHSDARVCHFRLPFLRKGDAATVNIGMKYNDITLFSRILFAENAFVRNKTVRIVIPPWLEAEVYERNFNEGISAAVRVDPESGNTIYTYTLTDQQEFEPGGENAPPYLLRYPYVMVVPVRSEVKGVRKEYFGTFDGVYAWAAELAARNDADTAGIAQVQRDITRSCESDEEAVRELYSWVQTNIRYIAFENGSEGHVPVGAATVYARKYGDCKGKSNLLKALLRSRGFDARLAWIWSGQNRPEEEIPAPEFNHMICVLFRDGNACFLDPTVKYMAMGECYDHIQGKMAMVEDGQGHMRLKTPEFGPEASVDSLCCEYWIEDGTMRGRAAMIFSGVWKESILDYMESSSSSVRMGGLTRMLQAGRVNDQITGIEVSGVDTHRSAARIDYGELRKSGLEYANGNIYIDMDVRKGLVNSPMDTVKRKNDYMMPCKGRVVRQEVVVVPEGYRVAALPRGLAIERPNYDINVTCSAEDGRVVYRNVFTIKDTWLRKEDFAQYNADLLRLRGSYGEQVVLEKLNP